MVELSSEEKTAKYLSMARELTEVLNNSLPKSISAATLTPNSKLPFKALSLREVLLCRVAELSATAMDLFDRQKPVSAFIVTRAVVETVSLAFWLHKRIINYLEFKDIKVLDNFLMKALHGGRDKAAPLESYNILSAVDHMDKDYNGYRELYNDLSEVAHPNWPGTLGAYGEFSQKGCSLILCDSKNRVPIQTGLATLAISIKLFDDYYNELAVQIANLSKHFDDAPCDDLAT